MCVGAYLYSAGTQHGKLHQLSGTMSTRGRGETGREMKKRETETDRETEVERGRKERERETET